MTGAQQGRKLLFPLSTIQRAAVGTSISAKAASAGIGCSCLAPFSLGWRNASPNLLGNPIRPQRLTHSARAITTLKQRARFAASKPVVVNIAPGDEASHHCFDVGRGQAFICPGMAAFLEFTAAV